MSNRWGRSENWQIFFSWAPKSLHTVSEAMKLKDSCSLEESYDKTRQCIKKQRHHFANKGLHSQRYGFSSSHVWLWELDSDWALKNWCFWTVVPKKTLEGHLDARRSNQSILREISREYWKDCCWSWSSNTLTTWCEKLKRPWCWEKSRAAEEDDRGWDG